MAKSEPYYRNNEKAHQALQAAGHKVVKEGWGGGTEGLRVPLESGHHLEIGQPAHESNGSWSMRVTRDHNHAGYDQGGIKLGDPGKQPRVPSKAPKATSSAKDLPGHVAKFLNHPQVRAAIGNDMHKVKGPAPMGPQFG